MPGVVDAVTAARLRLEMAQHHLNEDLHALLGAERVTDPAALRARIAEAVGALRQAADELLGALAGQGS